MALDMRLEQSIRARAWLDMLLPCADVYVGLLILRGMP